MLSPVGATLGADAGAVGAGAEEVVTVTPLPVRVTSAETIATSFPGFQDLMNGLGADMRIEDDDNQDQGDAA